MHTLNRCYNMQEENSLDNCFYRINEVSEYKGELNELISKDLSSYVARSTPYLFNVNNIKDGNLSLVPKKMLYSISYYTYNDLVNLISEIKRSLPELYSYLNRVAIEYGYCSKDDETILDQTATYNYQISSEGIDQTLEILNSILQPCLDVLDRVGREKTFVYFIECDLYYVDRFQPIKEKVYIGNYTERNRRTFRLNNADKLLYCHDKPITFLTEQDMYNYISACDSIYKAGIR